MRKLATSLALALCALAVPATAAAAPIFNLDIHHNPTHFPPGGEQGLAGIEVSTEVEGSPSANEQQRVRLVATSGSFKLSFDPDGLGPQPSQTTVDIPFGASSATAQAALEALPAIGSGNVSVSSSGGSLYTVTFQGALAATDVSQLLPGDGATPLALDSEFWVDIANVGPDPTSGPITLTLALPSGITRRSVRFTLDETTEFGPWSCPGSPGASVITCTGTGVIPRHRISRGLVFAVGVAAPEGATRTLSAKVSGGGGAEATARELVLISSTPAPPGILADSFTPDFLAADGLTPEREAGAHPDLFVVPFDFNTIDFPGGKGGVVTKLAAGSIRNVRVDTPPGFLGNPTAVGECPQAALAISACPPSSQVGRIDVATVGVGTSNVHQFVRPVYNLVHPRGAVSDLAMVIGGNPVHIRASLDPANRYAITTHVPDINESLPPYDQKLTLWGVPADPSHDSERCPPAGGLSPITTEEECPTDFEPKPFLTLPSQCESDNVMRIHHYDFWQDSGNFGPDITYAMPEKMRSCDKPRFEPTVRLNPTGRQANTPTGLDVSIQVPQNDSTVAPATPPVKSTVVRFPPGMTVNPAFADGLDGCTLEQIGLGTNDAVQCPDNSRIGEVFLTTPLLPERLEGSMYLAKQGANPFGSTFAMYMAIHDTEERGVLVKIPGRIDLDPNTGQMTTTFDDLPQFPFDDFTLSFRSGQRAPLVNPPTCGTHRIEVQVTSYAQPDRVLDASNTYEVDEGPNGTQCPASSNSRPFDPKMSAGTLNPAAGQHSPFIFRLTRQDTEQDISKVTTLLPPGLSAKLAGVSQCPQSAIDAISTAEGTGQAEFDNPHCPANSLVGVLNAGVGAGTNPNYFGGKVYLAGPYKDAPLSFVTVVPAIAGPYDFGSVVVRIAAYLDPRTAQAKAVSDPFPPIVHGILLHIRDIRLNLNRDQFTLNPTSCNPMAIDAQILSDLGALASPSSRFQVGECASLGFKPKLLMRLKGGTKRGAHPQLTATLIPRTGDANIAALSVAFPRSEFLENAHIRTVCTRADFAASNCPAGAIYGRATAYTPILDDPLTANVYLRSSSNLLPDVVPDFRGPPTLPLRIESAGRVDSINGGIRNTFDLIPDAPVTRVIFSLQGGKKGLLVNSRDICARTYRARVLYTAHNGAVYTERPKMVADCRRAKKGKKRRGHGRNARLLHQRAVTSQR